MNIILNYYSFILDEECIQEVSNKFKNISVKFQTNDNANRPQAGLDEIISQSLIVLSPAIINNFTNGLITNAVYDSIKNSILLLLNKVKGKKYSKVHARGKVEHKDADMGISFKKDGDSFYLNLPVDLPLDLQEKCIDKAFETMSAPEKNSNDKLLFDSDTMIGTFNPQSQEWEICSIQEIINKIRKQQ